LIESKENTMKKLMMLAALMTVGMGAAQAAERTIKVTVDNMYCAACPLTVSKAIQTVKGVKSAKVDYKTKTAVVVFDDATAAVEAIMAASTNAGYPARLAAN
jgi:mercuric ion binding protein